MSKPVDVPTNKGADVKTDDNWRPSPRPHAFFVPTVGDDTQASLVDPTEPLTHGCWVVAKLGDEYLNGILVTKHPSRAKTLTVQLGKGVVRGFEKTDVLRIVSVNKRA